MTQNNTQPANATAAIVFADGAVIWGHGLGAAAITVGEICFNTAMTGYQEIMTDPSYAGQIITFTFPHIGNVGTNGEDIEALSPAARGAIFREDITAPSNFRARENLNAWLAANQLPAICGVDTRALTQRIRDHGAPNGALCHAPDGKFDIPVLQKLAREWPGLNGMDLAIEVSCTQSYHWDETLWMLNSGHGQQKNSQYKVVAIDYGAKRNILRCLASAGCDVTVVPANASYDEIMQHKPDGVFLSNGPGDPAATGEYAVPVIQKILQNKTPLFGICLGHQLLALSIGGKTKKMATGHRGANHPVKDLQTGKVEITSQNHGFEVIAESLPAHASVTHTSLFDGTNEGLKLHDKPAFSVQYHPEASPGPHDSHYLFDRFVGMMAAKKAA
jgi:carbamoyl-phosphate synthase small subunit